MKAIDYRHETYGVVGKQGVGVLRKGKLLKMEQLATVLILDMDVSSFGVFGVTQEGRMFFLPFEE